MNLARFSVKNPVAVNLLMFGVIAMGLIASTQLVREFFPNIEPELITITVPYPGATPEEIERSVTRLIEREVEDVDGIKEIRASVFEGLTLLSLELEKGFDRAQILNDVRGEIDKVIPDLPDGAEEPEISEARPYIPAIAVVLHGEVGEFQLRKLAEEVEDDLLDMDQITELVTTGMRDREFIVEVKPDRLEALGLTFDEVGRAIQSLNVDVPGGQLKGERSNIRVRTVGEKRVAADLEGKPVLAGPDGRLITLGQIADVRPEFEDVVEKGRFATRRAISINVFKAPEQDAIKIAEQVRAYVAEHPTRLSGAVRLSITTDLSRIIEQRLDLMGRNALQGLILVLITLAVFLEVRVAFWVAVGLLFSFMGTFAVMLITGQSLNLISLFGLIVVLGLIVDDAIVVAENIFAKRRGGLPGVQAAVVGTNEVSIPVVAAVTTTCCAFAPLAFIEGRIGDFLGVLPQVVIAALSVSLVEAFLVLPSHLGHERKPSEGAVAKRLAKVGQWVHDTRHRFFEERLPAALGWTLKKFIPIRYGIVGCAMALLMIMGGLIAGGYVPFVLLQDTDALTVTAQLEMAAGTPEAETIATLERLERLALEQPEVDTVFSVVGTSFNDRGRVFAADPATIGQLVLELTDSEERQARGERTSVTLMTDLRLLTDKLPSVKRLSWVSQGGGPQGTDVEIRVRAPTVELLQEGVKYVTGKVNDYDGVTEVYDDLQLGKVEAVLELKEPARLAGLTTAGVALQVRHALFGFEAQDLQIGNDEVTVRVQLPEQYRRNIDDLGNLWIATPAGGRMPLAEAVSFTTDRGYASLSRVDGKRSATIKAEVDETRANVNAVNNGLEQELATIGEVLDDVSVSFEGAKKQTAESFGSLRILFPIALGLIFAVIAVLFRSYLQPIVVMSAIPFAMVGAVAGHYLLGYPLTILSMIGIVALAGIVVNDGLILVDLINRLRRDGMPLHEAVVEGAKGRMRAILLTSITTCVGLAPLMLEKSFQAQFLIPMAVAIVFGLAFATVIILVLVPMFYYILEDLRASWRWLRGGDFSRHMPWDPKTELDAIEEKHGEIQAR